MTTSVVIATQNVARVIGQCLDSLLPYYQHGYIKEIIVVDGLSEDGTTEIVNKYPVKLLFDEYRNPYIFSIPRNIGWQAASADVIMFIDADAYLSEGFFPEIHKFFEDKAIGGIGCRQLPIISNKVTKTIGEWWHYHFDNLKSLAETDYKPGSFIQKIYCKAVGFSEQVVISGPCYLVRRKCLEALEGFDELSQYGCEDIRLSQRITEKGWKVEWWLEAPVYHYPKGGIMSLIKQRYFWGKRDGFPIWKSPGSFLHKIFPILIRLGTPVIGLRLAIRYRNPLHLLLFPLAHYSWIAGYLIAFAKTRGGKE
jgi:glycosyltransferase involved in cell wall biosynthesis